ncbi:MAG TPA: amidase [Leptospiraceae bacterium]|nr:amidase [Leptospiraceae bacterium]HNN06016.1 amidase [Leptospiraceae bacterium]
MSLSLKTDSSLLLKSGSELSAMIRKREISSRETVELHIERIRKVNPEINAVIIELFDSALKQADAADEKVRTADDINSLPPFLGVPFTVKEFLSIKGMRHTGGLKSRIYHIADQTATAVERVISSGAVPVGITNVSELGMWMESYNLIYGRTNNAYASDRTSGGSSGGEGAVIGAGGVPFGLGSDIGGSVRIPAFFNGVFGHKPTGGLIPSTGHFPRASGDASRVMTVGPLARSAQDLFSLVSIMAGPDGKDHYTLNNFHLEEIKNINWKKIRIFSIEENGAQYVSDELKKAQRKLLSDFRHLGAETEIIPPFPEFRDSFLIWSSVLSEKNTSSFREMLGNGKKISPVLELLKWTFGSSDHMLPCILLSLIEDLPGHIPEYSKHFLGQCFSLKNSLENLLGRDGLLVYPSYSVPAPLHNEPLFRLFDWVYTGIFNALEFPSTQIPLGLGKQGLPLGVQIVSVRENDALTMAAAAESERMGNRWVMPDRF